MAYSLCFRQVRFTTPEFRFGPNLLRDIGNRADDPVDLAGLVGDGVKNSVDMFNQSIREKEPVLVLAAMTLEDCALDSIPNLEPILRMDSFKQGGKRWLFGLVVESEDLKKFRRPKASSGRNS
jgi:hypothetical protein